MAAVVLAGQKPLFELGAADLVVKALEEVKFANLKQLFAQEGLVAAQVRLYVLYSLLLCVPCSSTSSGFCTLVEVI